jgi:hypothetical protein
VVQQGGGADRVLKDQKVPKDLRARFLEQMERFQRELNKHPPSDEPLLFTFGDFSVSGWSRGIEHISENGEPIVILRVTDVFPY